jgi:hypothetical protein
VRNVVLSRIQADLAERDRFEDDKIQIYREMYWRELDIRNEISRSATFLSAIVSVVFGAATFIIEVKARSFDAVLAPLDVLLGLTVLSTYAFGILAVFFIVKTSHGRTYEFVPSPLQIEKYLNASRKYFEYLAPRRVNQRVREEFKEVLNQYFVECTDSNRRNNIIRAAYRFRAYRFAVLSVALLIASFVLLALSEALTLFKMHEISFSSSILACADGALSSHG